MQEFVINGWLLVFPLQTATLADVIVQHELRGAPESVDRLLRRLLHDDVGSPPEITTSIAELARECGVEPDALRAALGDTTDFAGVTTIHPATGRRSRTDPNRVGADERIIVSVDWAAVADRYPGFDD